MVFTLYQREPGNQAQSGRSKTATVHFPEEKTFVQSVSVLNLSERKTQTGRWAGGNGERKLERDMNTDNTDQKELKQKQKQQKQQNNKNNKKQQQQQPQQQQKHNQK